METIGRFRIQGFRCRLRVVGLGVLASGLLGFRALGFRAMSFLFFFCPFLSALASEMSLGFRV